MRLKIFDVFASKPFEGNPTAIVYWEGEIDKKRMQNLASELFVPDTLFRIRSSDPTLLFSSFAFSPHEELIVCGQGIIGGIFSLMEDGATALNTSEIETAHGRLRTYITDEDGPIVYTSLGQSSISEVDDVALSRIFEVLEENTYEPFRKLFVAPGRKRLLIEVNLDVLKQVQIKSSEVMDLCTDLGITGIVFFARPSAKGGLLRSRHFTRSLRGSEDAVTGGASGAILAFCNHVGIRYGDEAVLIHQGGFTTREGYIYAKYDRMRDEILVGGRAVKVIEGQIYV